jgi:hypothetical protein
MSGEIVKYKFADLRAALADVEVEEKVRHPKRRDNVASPAMDVRTRLGDAALDNRGRWVQEAFPEGDWQGTSYRVTDAFSIHADGIQDYRANKRYDAIGAIMEHCAFGPEGKHGALVEAERDENDQPVNGLTYLEAEAWLADRLCADLEKLRGDYINHIFRIEDVPEEYRDTEPPPSFKDRLKASTSWKNAGWFNLRPQEQIPPREWTYGTSYIRKFLSITSAAGGTGKSTLTATEALAMTTGRPLLGVQPKTKPDGSPLNVLLFNAEDPLDECERRLSAVCARYGVAEHEIGHLCLLSGRDAPLVVARNAKEGAQLDQASIGMLRGLVNRLEIDVIILDPFISLHRVGEKDNEALDLVAKTLGHIGDEFNAAIHIVAHTRKPGLNQTETTVDDLRGGSALKDAARAVRMLVKMTKEEAEQAGVFEENRWRYFRAMDGKANMARPAERAEWYRLASVRLANGNAVNDPDEVGVVERWMWPDAAALAAAANAAVDNALTHENIAMIKAAVGTDGAWSASASANARWVGHAIANALALDTKARGWTKQVAKIQAQMTARGHFKERDSTNNRNKKKVIVACEVQP